MYTSWHKYFDETKVKYKHNLNILHILIGTNGKIIKIQFE